MSSKQQPSLAHGKGNGSSAAVEVIEILDLSASPTGTASTSMRKRRRQNNGNSSAFKTDNAQSCVLIDLSSLDENPHQAIAMKRSNDQMEVSCSRAIASRRQNKDVIDLETFYAPLHSSSTTSAKNVFKTSDLIEFDEPDCLFVIDESIDRKMPAKERSNNTSCSQSPSPTFLNRIFDVFPDCDQTFAQQICTKHGVVNVNDIPTVTTAAILAAILEEMSDVGYPKVSKPTIARTNPSNNYDFESTNWEPPLQYKFEVSGILMDNFPFLSANGVKHLLSIHKSHYAPSHKAVCQAIFQASTDDPLVQLSLFAVGARLGRPWKLTLSQQNSLAKLLAGARSSVTVKTCRRHKVGVHIITCPVLQEEINFVEERQNRTSEENRTIVLRERAHKAAIFSGTTIECGCCYGDFALEEMCQCQDGHLFCMECLQRYAQEQLFGQQKTELTCLATTEQCSSVFDRTQLERALPAKVMEKYDEASFLANLEKANIEGLCKCPKCDFTAILPETENLFHCPNIQCQFTSCRHCGEESHIPLKCSEVEKKSDTDARKSVEEAMANARIRECPTCHKRFFKEEGCNKMTCACGTKICYVCRSTIKDYSHFCQVPHCTHQTASCSKCPLYSNSIEEDKEAVRRAALRAAGNIASVETSESETAKSNVAKLIQSISR